MFNSPVLDTAIGLVFIFLLYSLLATSVKEEIATVFGLRARMLRRGIIEGMLSCTDDENAWKSFGNAIIDFLKGSWRMISGKQYLYNVNTLGGAFYQHPIIKDYGSRRRFSVPSYLPKNNFSTILVDTLAGFADKHKTDIALKQQITIGQFGNLPTITKINYLVNYLLGLTPKQIKTLSQNTPVIDEETLKILQLHLKASYLNMETFVQKIEGWFDDSMNRVSGWYKRQVQFVLFFLGLVIAIMFNVDVIQIAGKLSTDKDARDELVQMAVKAADEYKDDPRVKNLDSQIVSTYSKDKITDSIRQKSLDSIKDDYKRNMDVAKNMINGDIKDANNLLALGWGDYGLKTDSIRTVKEYVNQLNTIKDSFQKDSSIKSTEKDTAAFYTQKALEQLYNNDWIRFKVSWVLKNGFKGRKLLGFLLLAFAVCLGAPFWFDLLQKLINLRATGKKEDTGNSGSGNNATTQPVQVTVTNNSNTGEAVG